MLASTSKGTAIPVTSRLSASMVSARKMNSRRSNSYLFSGIGFLLGGVKRGLGKRGEVLDLTDLRDSHEPRFQRRLVCCVACGDVSSEESFDVELGLGATRQERREGILDLDEVGHEGEADEA